MSTRSSSALLAVAALLASARAQDEHPLATGVDWPAKVKAAVESPRYAIQRAASNEVARAGDAAIPAVRAYLEANGRDAIPLLLADAMAQSDAGAAATRALLREWASDRQFYWRSQALAGLAQRKSADDAELFAQALSDPSHLFRVAGAKGVHALALAAGKPWEAARAILQDRDPRARVLFALHLWNTAREPAALPALVAAIADDRSFLDDDWGRRHAVQAIQAIGKVAGTNFGYQGTASLAGNAEAIGKLAKWAEVEVPPLRERDDGDDLGGIEIRSCRHGDLFVRWTKDALHFDLDRGRRVALPAAAQERLAKARAAALAESTEARRVVGKVVCDYVQLTERQPLRKWKVAPGAVPAPLAEFLWALADEAGAAGNAEVGGDLRARLPQFAPRD